jgi:phosphoglycolate phosphatase-like HAD superfamily hydrolase
VILYLFDIDGTLMRARRTGGTSAGARTFDAVFAELHGIERASHGVRFGGKTDPGLIDEILVARRGRPASADERAAFLAAYLPRLRAALEREGIEVIAGVVEALEWLAARPRVVLGVATGNVREGAEIKLGVAGLAARFVLGGYGCDSPLRAELVAAAIARGRALGAVDHVVVVGDTVHDIAAARACDALVCAVATGGDSAELLRDADAVFASLHELPAWHTARFGDA